MNLQKHIENVQLFGVPVVVAVNAFATDSKKECELVQELCKKAGAFDAIISDHWSEGGACANYSYSCAVCTGLVGWQNKSGIIVLRLTLLHATFEYLPY